MTETYEYPLRAQDDDELERLGLQHRVWKPETDRVIGHAGFRAGDHVADLGCGPGYLAADLARLVGAEGRILAVDSSELFVDHTRSVAGTMTRRNVLRAVHPLRCDYHLSP